MRDKTARLDREKPAPDRESCDGGDASEADQRYGASRRRGRGLRDAGGLGLPESRRRRWPRRSSLPRIPAAAGRSRSWARASPGFVRPTSSTARATTARSSKPAAAPAAEASRLRRGDRFRELGGPVQQCRFDDGLWFNAGPGRIPHHHVHVIDYCRSFGVALQPYIFASRANLVHTSHLGNGRTMQVRRAYYDLQGHIAELLDKCVVKPDMDLPISRNDLASLPRHAVEIRRPHQDRARRQDRVRLSQRVGPRRL